MKKQDYYKVFENLRAQILNEFKRQYLEKINKARDFQTADKRFNDTIMMPLAEETANKIMALGTIKDFFPKLIETYNSDKSKDYPEIFNKMMLDIEPAKRDESVKLLAEFQAQSDMLFFRGEETRKRTKPATSESSITYNYKTSIIWKSDNETEFIQLIYALHEAGYLDTEEKQITSLVLQVAKAFNVRLGRNWQSNFSKSINNRKPGYEPKIFDDLKKHLIIYRDNLINKNKRK